MSPKTFLLILKMLEAKADVILSRADFEAWAEGDFAEALGEELLVGATPAEEVVCPGCEEACLEDVQFSDDNSRAYVLCGQRSDIGRYPIAMDRLDRWCLSFTSLANIVWAAVKTVGEVTALAQDRLAFLGTAAVDGKTRELFLARGVAWSDTAQVFGNCLRLKTASHPAILTLAAMPSRPLLEGCELAVRPLAEIATFKRGRLKVSLDGAFPEVEPGPWGDLSNEPIMLDRFMVRFCEKRSRENRRCRREALLAAARNETVEMPPLAVPYKNGQSNKYFTHDLLNAWQGFIDENMDLPPLLSQYQASPGTADQKGKDR